MSPRGKFTAEPHRRTQSGHAKTDPIKSQFYIMGAFNLDVGKGAVRIVASDSKSIRQSVNTIKGNRDAQRSCDPDKQGLDICCAQQFVN